MIVLLKDGHEIDQVEPVVSTNKNGAKTLVKKRVWVQSEVRLSPADAIRLKKITDTTTYYTDCCDTKAGEQDSISNTVEVDNAEAGEAEVQDTIEAGIPPEGEPENIMQNSN